MAKIEKVIKGQHPSLLDADKANELISMVNGILSSRAQDPLSLKVDSDGAININVALSPIEVTMCINGIPAKRVIYMQAPNEE